LVPIAAYSPVVKETILNTVAVDVYGSGIFNTAPETKLAVVA
jgi:hypothetical protein